MSAVAEGPSIPGQDRPGRFPATLLTSFAIGFLYGAGPFSRWQAAIESAQVLAGTVQYPDGNAFYEYHLKAWTLINQALAPWLVLGVTERVLSIALSGLMTGLTFLSLTLCAYALSRRPLLSLCAPLFTLALIGSTNQYGVIYPIFIAGTEHTYGVIGRAMALTLFATLALGHRRSGAVLLGIAPAIHPTWGAWSILVATIILAWDPKAALPTARKLLPYFAAGACISALSLAYQLLQSRGLTEVDPESQASYLHAFLTHWDFHRRPVDLRSPGVYLGVATVLLSLLWLTAFRKDNAQEATLMYRALLVSGTLGLLGCAATWIPDRLPDIVNMAMPGRFLNLSIFAMPAVLLGILGRYQDRLVFKGLLFLHLGYALWNWFFLAILSSDRFGWTLDHWKEWLACSLLLIAIRAALPRIKEQPRATRLAQRAFVPALIACLVILAIGIALSEILKRQSLILSAPDAVLDAASRGEGLLITAGAMQFIQLRTRRPLLLNTGALDQITIVPSSGPEMTRVLDQVYGIDLFNPPEDIKRTRPGGLLPDSARALWESRSTADWQAIAQEFNATQILTHGETQLQLPEIARNDTFALYQIPKD